jgi:nucleotide-binding universal stress UspA family protein
MPTVLISTDFSPASRHAVDYACVLLKDKGVTLDLMHVFPLPLTYAVDGLGVTSIGDALEQVEELLNAEVERVGKLAGGIKIVGRVVTGSFLETLKEEAAASRPLFIVLGTAAFSDLYMGDSDPLDALRVLQVPVLFVPDGAEMKPINHAAYAVNYRRVGTQTPIDQITALVHFFKAKLDVVHADEHPHGYDATQSEGEAWLRQQLAVLHPGYYWQQDSDIVHAITSFVSTSNVDCLMVVPRKYGIWQNLFHQSRTKALARLNKVPVLAFHERER